MLSSYNPIESRGLGAKFKQDLGQGVVHGVLLKGRENLERVAPSSPWAYAISKSPPGEAYGRPGRDRDTPLRADRRVSRLAARETCSLWAQLGGKGIPTWLKKLIIGVWGGWGL